MRFFICVIGLLFFGGQTVFSYTLNLSEVKKHIDEKFAEAKVEAYPFPHIIIEDILPRDLYEELFTHWTELEEIGGLWTSGEGNPDIRTLWWLFTTVVVDQMIKRKIGKLFHDYLPFRFHKQIDEKILCNARLMKDHQFRRNYHIRAHIDHTSTFAPVMIYFPPYGDNDHVDLGTRFYIHKEGRESVDICYDELSKLELVKIVPFKANTLCTFMQSPKSWHSAARDENYLRRMYYSQIYLTEAFALQHYGYRWYLEPGYLDEENRY